MKKDISLLPKDVRLIDIVSRLPSIKRIALSARTLDNPKIMSVGLFKKSDLYQFYKFYQVKWIAPEIDYNTGVDSNGVIHVISYLLVQIEPWNRNTELI